MISDSNLFADVYVTAPLGKSDHVEIVGKWRISNNAECMSLEKRNWAKMSPDNIIAAKDSLRWKNNSDSVDVLWNSMHENAMKIVDLALICEIHLSHTGAVKNKSVWDRPLLRRPGSKRRNTGLSLITFQHHVIWA